MRNLKVVLVAISATIAMTFVGVSPAMAESTLLCNEDAIAGKCTSPATHVHSLAAKPALVTSIGTIECESALLLGEVLGLSAPQIIHGNLTYTNCKLGKTACTFREKSASVLFEVLKEGAELTKVTFSGELEVECGLLIKCTYGGSPELVGHGLGPLVAGDGGHLTYTGSQSWNLTGFCPDTSKLNALFVSLSNVYINS